MTRKKRTDLWQWLYPRRCPLCDGILKRKEGRLCTVCRRNVRPGRYLFPGGFDVFPYQDRYREAVQRFKYNGRAEYAAFFADMIRISGKDMLAAWRPDVLIPIPVHAARLRERGYNQAEELARELGKQIQIPCLCTAVLRSRNTLPQNALTPEERRRNLKNVFVVRKGAVIPKKVVLVDDIRTTGSTLEELARAVVSAGAEEIHAVCICCAGREDSSLQESGFMVH